ncbi:hypothetical protein EB796_013863 [Bugula neritina]|uniref:DNA (cytosine-5-)-methyltransferase n=1 Tax=Bugula neritina TaxID=10212 RepID=A0A7J7JQ78_BUGNE|nr:hypothetical protein EB796_013863 [Bugula neritina]
MLKRRQVRKLSQKNQSWKKVGARAGLCGGKLTARCKPWPGVTIRGSDAAQVAASSENQWIFWYGEHKVSEVQLSRLQSFDSGFSKSFKLGSGNTYTKAVVEALSDCWELLAETQATKNQKLPEDIDQFLDWARQHFTDEKSILPEGRVSKFVSAKLAYIVETINNAEESTDFEEDDDDEDFQKKKQPSKSKKVVHQPKQPSRDKAAAKVRAQDLEIEDICLACGFEKTPESNIRPHPLFIGGLCDECLEVIRSTAFSYGADGCMSYCAICGGGGSLLVCDKENCGRTYCTDCLVELGSDDVVTAVEECDPWSCFLCEPATFPDLLIKRRQDSQQRLLEIFQKPSILHNVPKITEGSKLRVLSLFDGIGTAKVVLENLNLDIEAYYSVEIEDDAIQVVRRHHGDVHQLGDIRSLTEEKLAELGRIDLLVGGSPCNDLACVNPARKGLYDATGTGILFFDFYRILMTLMSIQPGHSVFWLFENVVHMNKETKATISRFLECEPVKLDAGYFSAQSRNRYFWGNIPGMYEPVAEDIKALRITLQDVLSEGREAVVPKIRTVTTRGASLLQGRNEDTHAVVMNGQSDKLWPTELEKVFGFPEHYTDVGNLAPGKRQKLLGRSWCVPVVEHLLKPLTKLFVMKPLPKIQCSCHKNNIQ